MKKRKYFLSLFCLILLIAACSKQENVDPRGTPPKQDVLKDPPVTCDSTKDVRYVLTNHRWVSFTVIFTGSETYTYTLPKNGTMDISLRPGVYSLQIVPDGDFDGFLFVANKIKGERDDRGYFEHLKISSCSTNQHAEVY
ncbi:MAG: hypothetical protein INR69_14430 [Mucilaginibacter polytrichastri]|nr:hypothetical protein [Mucilaginibacter polytrichastri]